MDRWCLYTVLITLLCVLSEVGGNKVPLHHRMTKGEIQQSFGVESHDEVPEYDVTEPYQSTAQGDFLSYNLHNKHKTKRSVDYQHDQHYTIRAFGRKLHLNLRENKDLIAPGLKLETYKDGKVVRSEIPRSVHYTGRVSDDPQSTVAITQHEGLSGNIRVSDEAFYIRPVPSRLMEGPNTILGGTPHFLYKERPSNSDANFLGNDVITERKDNPKQRRTHLELSHQLKIASDADTNPPHRYMELAFVADEQVEKMHGNETSIFLLVLANMVAAGYQDNTIGKQKITIVVTKLAIATNKELELNKEDPIKTKLDGIARWASAHNPAKDSDPDHFDIASLVARGGVGAGMAIVGCLCSRSCVNSNVERGLQTSTTLMHEIAHNFGVDHDAPNCPTMTNIMSTVAIGGKGAVTWSKCSEKTFQDILKNPEKSFCLNDKPTVKSRPTLPPSMRNKLPGVVMDRDKQCKLHYGPSFFACSSVKHTCGSVFCTSTGAVCEGWLSPAADGTRCGPRSWCIKGECVDDGSPVIDGGWSQWSDFRPCTKSCDHGVTYKERTCTNPAPKNGGDNCEGSTKGHYKICKSVKCPNGKFSDRDLQCKKKDPLYVVYFPKPSCYLSCKIGLRVYPFKGIIDGTRCSTDRSVLDVCIQNKCRVVGCDHVLESGSMRDRCSKCNGDGSTCEHTKGSYTKVYRTYGQNNADTMVTLPVGSSNISFKKRKVSWNYIGIDDMNDTHLIKIPSFSKTLYYAGSKIQYNREGNRAIDSLVIDGPLTEPLKIKFIFIREENGGIDYSYFRPTKNPTATAFEWKLGQWSSSCSVICGGGIKTRVVKCIRSDDKTSAGDWACPGPKPDTKMNCNVQKCPPVWDVTGWKPCSKSCGKGNQSRTLLCRQQLHSTHHVTVPQSLCDVASKPNVKVFFRYCNEFPCRSEWRGLHWSECSTTCGPAVITRKLQCYRVDESGVEIVVADELCQHAVKPPTTEPCNEENPCKPHEWKIGTWSSTCSATCGGGTKTRVVICLQSDDKIPADDLACPGPKPDTQLNCHVQKCPPVWHLTNWKPCSKSCGKGDQSRTLLCRQQLSSTSHVTVSQSLCDVASKPNEKELFRHCNEIPCNAEWRALQWSKCSTTCDPGVITRKVQCYQVDKSGVENVVADELCIDAVKPLTTKPCNEDKPCKAPTEIGIACFKTSESLLDQFEVLSNGKTVKECAQLAHDKGYTHFAMGYKGICYSGPNAVQLYYKGGAATKSNCVNGIGGGVSYIYAYSLVALPAVKQLGCFGDGHYWRVFPEMYANFRGQINWRNMQKTISECAQVAYDMHHSYFAVHYYAECYTATDEKAARDFKLRGPSKGCWSGVGSGSSSFFYTFNFTQSTGR